MLLGGGYSKYGWAKLVDLWSSEYYNLLHILRHLPQEQTETRCHAKFGSTEFVTIDWLIGHIFRHNEYHLRHLFWLVGEAELPDDEMLYGPIQTLPH